MEEPSVMQLRNVLDGIETVHGYNVNPEMCCERCVFNSGKHSDWCTKDIDLAKAFKPIARRLRKLQQDYDPLFRAGLK